MALLVMMLSWYKSGKCEAICVRSAGLEDLHDCITIDCASRPGCFDSAST